MYEVGDIVRIKHNLKLGDGTSGCTVVRAMLKNAGKEFRIEKIWKDKYRLKGTGWTWTKEMFEPLTERNEV